DTKKLALDPHDHDTHDNEQGTKQAVQVVAQVPEGDHEPATRPAQVLRGRELHDLEDVGQGPGPIHHLGEIHGTKSRRRGLNPRPRIQPTIWLTPWKPSRSRMPYAMLSTEAMMPMMRRTFASPHRSIG